MVVQWVTYAKPSMDAARMLAAVTVIAPAKKSLKRGLMPLTKVYLRANFLVKANKIF